MVAASISTFTHRLVWVDWMDTEIQSEDVESCAAQCFIRGPCQSFAFSDEQKMCFIGDAKMKNKLRSKRVYAVSSAIVYTRYIYTFLPAAHAQANS